MNSFIKAVETWVRSPDGSLLEFGEGHYGAANRFGAVSRGLVFGRGEGLPGRVWDQGAPIVLKDFEGSYFRRTAAARAAGLTAAIAMPFHRAGELQAVLVFFCGDDAAHAGAIELWHHDARVTTDMRLVDGYFGSGAAPLEAASRDSFLPRGSGLPGMAWQRGASVLIDDLGQSARFLRRDMASEIGMTRGLGLPCETSGDDAYVLTFLSAAGAPVAQRVESWLPAEDGGGLQRAFGYGEATGSLPADDTRVPLAADGGGAIGRAAAGGLPAISTAPGQEPPPVGDSAAAAGLQALVAIPVLSEGRVAEVVALYF